MKLHRVDNVSFTKTYDMHVHSGHWWVDAAKNTHGAVRTQGGDYKVLKDLSCDVFELANGALSSEANRVDKVFVSNLDCMTRFVPDVVRERPFIKDEVSGNLELLKRSQNPNIYLYATGQPGSGSAKTLEKVIDKAPQKFVGIKLHPSQLGIPADDKLYEPYMELARKKKLPVLFHSQAIGNNDVSDPRKIYELAKKYPDVPVILGHTGAGGSEAHDIAIDVIESSIKNKDANLYADISWMNFNNDLPQENPKSIIKLIRTLKNENAENRVLFGSDVPVGIFGEHQASGRHSDIKPSCVYDDMQNKIKNAIKENFDDGDEIIDKVFYKNTQELFFGEKNNTEAIKNAVKKTGCPKKIAAVISACVFGGIGIALIFKKFANNKNK